MPPDPLLASGTLDGPFLRVHWVSVANRALNTGDKDGKPQDVCAPGRGLQTASMCPIAFAQRYCSNSYRRSPVNCPSTRSAKSGLFFK